MTFEDFKSREFRDVLEGMFDAMRDGSHPGGPAMWCDGRRRAVEACDRALARIGDHMARPMGAEAARYVELFESREHVTERDVERALKAYGSDHMAARRIIDHAHELGLKGFDAEATTEPARRFVGDVEGYALGAPYSVEGAALLALAKTDALLHEAWKSVPYRFSPPPCPTPREVV